MRRTDEEKLQAIREKREKADAQARLIERRIAERKRKADLRMAIVLGQIVLKDGVPDWALKLVDEKVISASDRALFGLPERAAK